MKKLVNPYPDDGLHEMARLNSDMWQEEYDFIRRIRIERGTAQVTANILWKKLCDELRKRNITAYTDEDEFCRFLNDCELGLPGEVIPRRPATQLDEARNAEPVGRTIKRSSPPDTDPTSEPSNVQGGFKPRKRRAVAK